MPLLLHSQFGFCAEHRITESKVDFSFGSLDFYKGTMVPKQQCVLLVLQFIQHVEVQLLGRGVQGYSQVK